MPPDDILEQRRLARQEKAKRDARLLRLHEIAADALDGPSAQTVRESALDQMNKWEKGQLCSRYYIDGWRRMLDLPSAQRRAAMLRTEGDGTAFRQNTPFVFRGEWCRQ